MNVQSAILSLMTLTACAQESLVWTTLPSLPDRLGVAAPFAGVSGGSLLVGGGANFPDRMPWEGGRKVWHDTVWALAQPGGAWQAVGLVDLLASDFGAPVDVFDPFRRVTRPARAIGGDAAGPAYAVAVGLAMRQEGDR